MNPSISLRWWRALFVAGALIALSFGTARLARADTACAPTDLSCTGASVAPTVPPGPAGDTVDRVKDQASDTTKTGEDTLATAQDTVGDVVNGLLGSGDPDPGGGAREAAGPEAARGPETEVPTTATGPRRRVSRARRRVRRPRPRGRPPRPARRRSIGRSTPARAGTRPWPRPSPGSRSA